MDLLETPIVDEDPSNFQRNSRNIFKTPPNIPSVQPMLSTLSVLRQSSSLKTRQPLRLSSSILKSTRKSTNSNPFRTPAMRNIFRSSSSVPIRPTSSSAALSGESRSWIKINTRRFFTPKTTTATSTSTPGKSSTSSNRCIVMAIVDGRGLAQGEVGIASIDQRCPELQLSQFSDSSSYSRLFAKILQHSPSEVLFPHTACESGKMTRLFHLVSENFSHCRLITVRRKYFNDKMGMQRVQQLCHQRFEKVFHDVDGKYYALAACAALLKYFEFTHNIFFAPGALKIGFSGAVQSMLLDSHTVRNLELLENARDADNRGGSLLGLLNRTRTFGGARLLRANIMQPPIDIVTIRARQDAVAELMESPEIFFPLQSVLTQCLSLDSLLTMIIQLKRQPANIKFAETKITNVIYLKHVIQIIPSLEELLGKCSSSLLSSYTQIISNSGFTEIKNKINSVIHADVTYQKGLLNMRTQKCFAIKRGVNGLLDVARKLYTEQVNDLEGMIQNLSNEHSLPLRISYNNQRGFYIQMPRANLPKGGLSKLPPIFMKATLQKNFANFTTIELIKINERLKESLSEIYLIADIVLSELLKDLQAHIGLLYHLSEVTATLDMLLSFAHVGNLYNYIRPEFSTVTAVKRSRHPILESLSRHPVVANHIYLSEDNNFVVITGPNMSGKSTYLRQLALIQIMAQIGCFVPAEFASFRVADNIFTRIGTDDDLEKNASTFTVEMREMQYIVESAGATSLVIMDELGRSNSCDEGIALCFALCEHLALTKAFCVMTTHFKEMMVLEDLYLNVENCHFEVRMESDQRREKTDQLEFTHVLKKGRCKIENYGLQIAKLSPLPKSIVEHAEAVVNSLKVNEEQEQELSLERRRQERAMEKLVKRLELVADEAPENLDLTRRTLHALKVQYFRDLNPSFPFS